MDSPDLTEAEREALLWVADGCKQQRLYVFELSHLGSLIRLGLVNHREGANFSLTSTGRALVERLESES